MGETNSSVSIAHHRTQLHNYCYIKNISLVMKTDFKAFVNPVYIHSSILLFPVSSEKEKQKQILGRKKNPSKENKP